MYPQVQLGSISIARRKLAADCSKSPRAMKLIPMSWTGPTESGSRSDASRLWARPSSRRPIAIRKFPYSSWTVRLPGFSASARWNSASAPAQSHSK